MKIRLDVALVERELAETRRKAQTYIKKGVVTANGKVVLKASAVVSEKDILEVAEREKYVSRGGKKLEAALEYFKIDAAGAVALDVGASTGGFTDCLLQKRAKKVVAIDAGHGQLAKKLKNDPRVELREGVNARFASPSDFTEKFDIIVTDVSFISVLKILPAVVNLAKKECRMVVLVKPQFEVGKKGVGKGGIVKNEDLRLSAVKKVEKFFTSLEDWDLQATMVSPIREDKGNVEYLVCAQKLKR